MQKNQPVDSVSIKKKLIKSVTNSWSRVLNLYFSEPVGDTTLNTLIKRVQNNQRFTPPLSKLFTGLDKCAAESTQVVVLGAEINPIPGAETGIAFSRELLPGEPLPALLSHILGNLSSELPSEVRADLSRWCGQGVLFIPEGFTLDLNTKAYEHKSHAHLWKELILLLLEHIKLTRMHGKPLAFLLLGKSGEAYRNLLEGMFNGVDHKVMFFSAPQPRESLYIATEWPGVSVLHDINAYLESNAGTSIRW